jgi:hypothetical protein
VKICIATPMYGGNAKSVYITSLSNLVMKLAQRGHSVMQTNLTNESLITRARNTLTYTFLDSDCDAMLFIDGDHSFDPDDIVKMVESGKDLIGAIYPMKAINWTAVRNAALLGKEDLEAYSGIFAVNTLSSSQEFTIDEPFKVLDVGTGMMFITRKVFEELRPICKTYKNNSVGSSIPFGGEVVEYFTTAINESGILLSEDYAFCAMWRSLGNDVWAAPWVKITHAGEYNFAGQFAKTVELQNEVNQFNANNSQKGVG